MRRAHLILNPTSGRGDRVDRILDWARDQNIPAHKTRQAGDGVQLARQVVDEHDADRVIACGGDGTINEVVNGLNGVMDRVSFGVIPMGTGNDLARSLELEPDFGPETALAAIEVGRTRRIDVLEATTPSGTRLLANAACGGFATKMNEYLDSPMKKWLGAVSYPLAALRTMADIPWHRVDAEADDELIEAETAGIILANGRFAAGGQRIAPSAALDDGQLDLLIVTAESFDQRAATLLDYLAGHFDQSEFIIHRRARTVRITCDPVMHFRGDGEDLGPTELTCNIHPAALSVVTP